MGWPAWPVERGREGFTGGGLLAGSGYSPFGLERIRMTNAKNAVPMISTTLEALITGEIPSRTS